MMEMARIIKMEMARELRDANGARTKRLLFGLIRYREETSLGTIIRPLTRL